jgi:hypothetical protein
LQAVDAGGEIAEQNLIVDPEDQARRSKLTSGNGLNRDIDSVAPFSVCGKRDDWTARLDDRLSPKPIDQEELHDLHHH